MMAFFFVNRYIARNDSVSDQPRILFSATEVERKGEGTVPMRKNGDYSRYQARQYRRPPIRHENLINGEMS